MREALGMPRGTSEVVEEGSCNTGATQGGAVASTPLRGSHVGSASGWGFRGIRRRVRVYADSTRDSGAVRTSCRRGRGASRTDGEQVLQRVVSARRYPPRACNSNALRRAESRVGFLSNRGRGWGKQAARRFTAGCGLWGPRRVLPLWGWWCRVRDIPPASRRGVVVWCSMRVGPLACSNEPGSAARVARAAWMPASVQLAGVGVAARGWAVG